MPRFCEPCPGNINRTPFSFSTITYACPRKVSSLRLLFLVCRSASESSLKWYSHAKIDYFNVLNIFRQTWGIYNQAHWWLRS
jgi:hypothetical protein